MTSKQDYIKEAEKQMDKYKTKISKIEEFLKGYKSEGREQFLAHQNDLQDKFNQAEKMLKKITDSSEKEYEQIKESATKIFDDVKEAFYEMSSFLTFEQLSRAKDEVIDFGNEKLDEAQTYIKEHPLTAAAWAVGIGFLIGSLITRSK